MVFTCFVCKWRGDREPRRSFHKFPADINERQKWLDIIGSNKSVGKRTSLCSIHFENNCFRYGSVVGRKILNTGSLPSLYLTKTPDLPLQDKVDDKTPDIEPDYLYILEEPQIYEHIDEVAVKRCVEVNNDNNLNPFIGTDQSAIVENSWQFSEHDYCVPATIPDVDWVTAMSSSENTTDGQIIDANCDTLCDNFELGHIDIIDIDTFSINDKPEEYNQLNITMSANKSTLPEIVNPVYKEHDYSISTAYLNVI
ncbi:uncharacterized protein LOC103571775 isoform X1 [Microplitis demolitor]|uniref:uncharacterized protein LOC103571775 isoform X1 n=1 Tax=Microplitis demolitor TaxID=69319 RepID=UPI00235B6495|nr:uncharacterized protein LOC103571775 isoform X1 [Microplitis demolitor]